jgi:hypothetical protein
MSIDCCLDNIIKMTSTNVNFKKRPQSESARLFREI